MHRLSKFDTKRRLFGLAGLAPLREQVRPPRRPEPGRGRGRPPILRPEAVPPPALPDRAPSRLERRAFDYSDLEAWMAHADQAMRQTRRVLDQLALRTREPLSHVGVAQNDTSSDDEAWP